MTDSVVFAPKSSNELTPITLKNEGIQQNKGNANTGILKSQFLNVVVEEGDSVPQSRRSSTKAKKVANHE